MSDQFYLRYMIHHQPSSTDVEELSFTVSGDGQLHYLNTSSYRRAPSIHKEAYLTESVLSELKRIVRESGILDQSDENWPAATREDSQELEIVLDNVHIAFECARVSTLAEIHRSKDPEGLSAYYYLVQDIKSLIFSLISLHFKINPIP